MKTFAYIVSPQDITQLKDYWPRIKFVPDFILRAFLKKQTPIKIADIETTVQNRNLIGYLIACPFLDLNNENAIDEIISASLICRRLGASIIGMDNLAGKIVDANFHKAFKKLALPVTTGNSLASWTMFEAVFRIARVRKIDLGKAVISIIGADNSLGRLCAKKMAEHTVRLNIVGFDADKLEELKEKITYLNLISVNAEMDAERAIKEADIVICLDQQVSLTGLEYLKPKAVLCHIHECRGSLAIKHARKDVTITEAGLIKIPKPLQSGLNVTMEPDIIPASLAETILLTLDAKLVNYSLGDEINLDRCEEIANIAARYHFEVYVPEAPLV